MRNHTRSASVVLIALLFVSGAARAQTADEWSDRGYDYMMGGHFEKAVECYTKVIELEPNNKYAHDDRARAYLNLGLYDKTIADYKKTIEIDPDDNEAYWGLARAYYRKGDYDTALKYSSISIERDATVSTLDDRANIYRALGRYDEALADIEEALKYSDTFYHVYYTRGLIYQAMGETEKAAADLKHACDNGETEACAALKEMGK
jgi:tetratricopeptide (TPR) repeat protein